MPSKGTLCLILVVALASLQPACTKTPPTVADPLSGEQALDLVSRWVSAQSAGVNIKVVNVTVDAAQNAAKARLTVADFRFRDALDPAATHYSGDAEADFTFLQNRTWVMTRFATVPGSGSPPRSWEGLYVTEAYKSGGQQRRSLETDISANESRAIANTRTLITAENLFSSMKPNQCGTIRDLIREHLIDERYASDTVQGYRLSIIVAGDTCGILAVPKTLGFTGRRSFYASVSDGLIRFSTDGSLPTANYPKLP